MDAPQQPSAIKASQERTGLRRSDARPPKGPCQRELISQRDGLVVDWQRVDTKLASRDESVVTRS
jgi:hypothetical protein